MLRNRYQSKFYINSLRVRYIVLKKGKVKMIGFSGFLNNNPNRGKF